jgi:hypothetical protein
LELVRQSQPVFDRSGFQASQRANRALARAFGGLCGFDKQVVDVGFALVRSRRFSDVHWPLHVAFSPHNVKRNRSHFSHYYALIYAMRCENKPLFQDDPRFFQDITSTAVEVGLGRRRRTTRQVMRLWLGG